MPNAADPITVIAVADSTVLRAGLRELLCAEGDISVVGEAESVFAVMDDLAALQPDVVVIDVRDPHNFDPWQRRQLQARGHGRPILLLSPRIDDESILELVASGASGYVCEDTTPDFLRNAVRTLHQGGSPVCPQIAEAISARLLARSTVSDCQSPQLSADEFDLLERVGRGETYREIGRTLQLDQRAVKHQISTVVRKISVRNRTAAAAWCARYGRLGAEDVQEICAAEQPEG